MSALIYSKDDLMANFEGDEDILIDLISEFEDKSSNLILDIKVAVETKDADKFKISAHTFKGVVSNFYAEELRLIAYDLEKMGMDKNFTGAIEKIDQLSSLLSKLLIQLAELKQSLK